jgi:hypothetical protein
VDLATYAMTAALLVGVAAAASYLPDRHARRYRRNAECLFSTLLRKRDRASAARTSAADRSRSFMFNAQLFAFGDLPELLGMSAAPAWPGTET